MDSVPSIRIDKWLWTVRVFKTRTLASEACQKGRVFVNGNEVKASKDVKPGDTVGVRKPPVMQSFIVTGIPKGRVGAKLLPDYLNDITPPEEQQKLEPGFLAFQGYRKRGEGRPTKKERRNLDAALSGEPPKPDAE